MERRLPPPPIRGLYRTDARARAAYAEAAGIYRIVPAAVCLPSDLADLAALVRWAAAERVPLVPRGAGSAMAGGNVGDGVMVDLTAMQGDGLTVDAGARRARTAAHVRLGALDAAAAAHGLRLPPDPSSGRWATVGGVVSTNAAGARSVRYGSMRRWVEALVLVTADGESVRLERGVPAPRSSAVVTRFERDAAPSIRAAAAHIAAHWPRVRKNSTGYALDAWLASGDLLDLVVGAEGTLGIVTEVEWRLDRRPARRAALRVTLDGLEPLAGAVAALLSVGPSAVELLDRTFLDVVAAAELPADVARLAARAGAVLLVELEGEDAEALAAQVLLAADAVAPWATAVETAVTEAEAERLWAIRHAASPILARLPEDRRSLQVIEDACVPVERLGDYIRAVRRASASRSIQAVIFGHAGDGNIHVNLLPELARPDWETQVAGLLEEVTTAVIRLGGVPSGEHGAGRLRAGFLERLYGPEIVGLFRDVKRAFDPAGILNPGIVLGDGSAPIDRLKTGHGATTLPPDIAAALREIERTGGYARPRLELADLPPAD